jgi:Secretion system C-terminal sorting domain
MFYTGGNIIMKYVYYLALFFSFSIISFAQEDTINFIQSNTPSTFYFPLKAGNLWQYKEPPPPEDPYIEETRTGRDTTFSNGQTYTELLEDSYGYPDTSISSYIRVVDNRVYKYFPNDSAENLVYDFSKNLGDTVSIFPNPPGYDTSVVTVLDTGTQNIFGTLRKYKTFYNRTKHVTLYWIDQITDSLGITFSQIEPGLQLYLVGAIIDSVKYGNVLRVMPNKTIIPTNCSLSQNYPNPFNPTTCISYSLGYPSFVSLVVYNVLGQKIATLVSEAKAQGVYSVTFNTLKLPSGIYLYRLQTGNSIITKKMSLIK